MIASYRPSSALHLLSAQPSPGTHQTIHIILLPIQRLHAFLRRTNAAYMVFSSLPANDSVSRCYSNNLDEPNNITFKSLLSLLSESQSCLTVSVLLFIFCISSMTNKNSEKFLVPSLTLPFPIVAI